LAAEITQLLPPKGGMHLLAACQACATNFAWQIGARGSVVLGKVPSKARLMQTRSDRHAVGVPKEIKDHEYRVGLITQLCANL
jgi:hypothetical protein